MAVSPSLSAISLAAVVLTALSLVGATLAADAPAPSPTSAAADTFPSLAAVCFSAAALLFGSALTI